MQTIECSQPGLTLSVTERRCLELLAARPTATAALRQRARIVLECARGMSHAAVADAEGVAEQIVGQWRERFMRNRLASLDDAPF